MLDVLGVSGVLDVLDTLRSSPHILIDLNRRYMLMLVLGASCM